MLGSAVIPDFCKITCQNRKNFSLTKFISLLPYVEYFHPEFVFRICFLDIIGLNKIVI